VLLTNWTHQRVEARSETWEGRLGRDALETRERALTVFVVGWLAGLLFLTTFIVATAQNLVPLQVAALVLLFAGSLPLTISGAVLMYRASRLILEKWDLPNAAGRTLKRSMLRDPAAFDKWLAHQQATRQAR
jgi:hypothetical protein